MTIAVTKPIGLLRDNLGEGELQVHPARDGNTVANRSRWFYRELRFVASMNQALA